MYEGVLKKLGTLNESITYQKNFYAAKKTIFPQLEAVVGVLLNLQLAVDELAAKHKVSVSELMTWVDAQLPSRVIEDDVIVEDEEEDYDDGQDE